METELIHITIDGKEVSVPKGTTVYNAAKLSGIEIPIFCYHDRMPPFGACRMCLVEVENMPKLQTSCTLEARAGMHIKTGSQKAKSGQEGILELLLINHPLDCPICDRGGECPLQDQTLKYGPGKSRFFEKKRLFPKRIPLGPVLMLDRERCIACARCTRFGELIAGDHALEFIERGYRTEIGTHKGGPAESKFIGNTIMICPVGALTSQVYRFRARPWDNDSVKSTCTLCPIGCSMILDSRDGEIVRTRSTENKEVNDVWLCDKGWFGYEHVYQKERLSTPLIRENGALRQASWEEAFHRIEKALESARPSRKIGAFGGNPLTFEENFLFQNLIRTLGVNHLDHRIGEPIFSLQEELIPGGMESSPGTLEELKHASLLGLDITEEFPLLWLRLKQAENKGADLAFLGHFAPEVHSYFKKIILHAPGEEISHLREHLQGIREEKGALLVGSQYLHSPKRKEILRELIRFKESHPSFMLHLLEGNEGSMGAREAGMHPELLPFGKEIENPGLDALSLLRESAATGWDFLWVAGANPAKKFPRRLFKEARTKLKFLLVQDLFLTETADVADVVLPTLSFMEKEGSFINIEGRVQKLLPGKLIPLKILSDKEIFQRVAELLQLDIKESPSMERVKRKDYSSFKKENDEESLRKPGLKVTFAHFLFDEGVRMQYNKQLFGMVKKPFIRMHPDEAKSRNFLDGQALTITNPRGRVQGTLKMDPKVSLGTLVLPLGFNEMRVQDLEMHYINGESVEVS